MSDIADALLQYIDAAPSPYHAVAQAAARLHEASYRRLDEGESWQLAAGERVYVQRADASLAAFVVGERPAADTGFLLIGAHTDSPNLRVKPRPDLNRHGVRQLGVEVYGGVLLSTWLDRDLSMAGRVMVRGGAARLVDFHRPLLRIPNLAIHLNRKVNSEGLLLNKQRHLAPVLAIDAEDVPELQPLLAAQLSEDGDAVKPEDILSWDLCLYDTQPSSRGGLQREFLFAPRLDNLASCFAALTALLGAPARHEATRGIVLYDHEEVGSRSAQGADSPFLQSLLERIASSTSAAAPDAAARAASRSFMISVDMAHAIHPNYADRHEPQHQPLLGGGPVIKSNANQAYATDGASAARFADLCREAEVPVQQFVVRSDMACGSTIGPITAGRVGVATVDVGSPLLSMHSIREMAAAADAEAMQKALDRFFA